jgi:DNA modification methylase
MEHVIKDRYALYNGDCVEVMAGLPDNSIDYSVYSPPFSSLYIYSDSERDMGNSENDEEFFKHYRYAIRQKLRITKPGRLSTIHVKDLVYYSNASERGDRGLKDFPGECIRAHVEEGWTYHSRHVVGRCPVREMTKSKPDGLLYKNFRKDAARVRAGLPEYIITFRKWADGEDQAPPVMHDYLLWREWAGEGAQFVQKHSAGDFMDQSSFEREYYEALDIWQKWADPIWWDTRMTDVLNVDSVRGPEDERHLCPMPLDLTERSTRLWSNAGDVVLSPFAGIGSEGVVAMRTGRRFIGIELKPSYFNQSARNMRQAHASAPSLLDALEVA